MPPLTVALPRLSLAQLPTPLEETPRLRAALGGPRLWFKRDDLTGFALGGNKVRKLEFVMAEALAAGADVVVSAAGPQSNHLRATAAAARKLGLEAVLIMHGAPPLAVQGNHLLDRLLGATIRFTGSTDRSQLDAAIAAEAEALRRAGRRPFVIPRGGATPTGSAAYVAAVAELEAQCQAQGLRLDHLVVAVGSCGTLAGLWVGQQAVAAPYRLWGLSVSRPAAECAERVASLGAATARLLGLPAPEAPLPTLDDAYLGPAYGVPSSAAVEAIRLVARTEGIFLDPVYTGKAFAGLMALIRRGVFRADENVLFWHTGGAPALFAHPAALLAGEDE